MKKSKIIAILWMIGFPLVIIFIVSKFLLPSDTDNLIYSRFNDASKGDFLLEAELDSMLLNLKAVTMPEARNYINDDATTPDYLTVRQTGGYQVDKQELNLNKVMPRPEKEPCSDDIIDWVTADQTTIKKVRHRKVKIDCSLYLKSSDKVYKRLILEGESATNVTINCNGATINGGVGTVNEGEDMIEVKSEKFDNGSDNPLDWEWKRPQNITIKNCNIIGSVRVWGMGRNGQAPDLKESSRREEYESESHKHVERVRHNAPRNIVFDNVIITGVGRNPVYFAPGVTYSKLINSEIKGKSDAVAIYLDAESYKNTIKNNYIHVDTKNFLFESWDRPQMAVDGSSHNIIMNNTFSGLNHGGIYLYRNCGEGGTIRHSTPSHNEIINNIFIYKTYKGNLPAVYLGSRDYGRGQRIYKYCDEDDGRPYGSSASEKDYARYNVIMQNQFYERLVPNKKPPLLMVGAASRTTYHKASIIGDYIQSENWDNNSPNYIDYNRIVTEETVEKNRPAGCYISDSGWQSYFILHGQSVYMFDMRNGEPYCLHKHICNDGNLIDTGISSYEVTKRSFDCRVSGNNDGCQKTIYCPPNQKIIGVTAACNLEYGKISDGILPTVPWNHIKVIRPSDNVSSGSCYVGNNRIKSGQIWIIGVPGASRTSVGCKEHDENGGDCHIKGILYCRKDF